jgi:SAM-dependent methyltransferase
MMSDRITRSFDAAAAGYDAAALLQRNVAEKLVRRAGAPNAASILDIGCGTGAVASLAAQKWPQATITGIDASPAMLQEAQKKVSGLTILQADAADLHLNRKFDLIFSSMLLHWLPRPGEVLKDWTELYGDLRAFLHSLKQTGAHQPRGGHKPFSAAKLRRLLNAHRGPFTARFDILYLSVSVP